MITRATVPPGCDLPGHVEEVGSALDSLYEQIQTLWSGNGIDGRSVARLLAEALLDDVEHLVLVLPNWVHNRSPFEYAVAFATRLRARGLMPAHVTVTVFGYGTPPERTAR